MDPLCVEGRWAMAYLAGPGPCPATHRKCPPRAQIWAIEGISVVTWSPIWAADTRNHRIPGPQTTQMTVLTTHPGIHRGPDPDP